MFTVARTEVGAFDESVFSGYGLIGVRTPDADRFFSLSVGLGSSRCHASCSSTESATAIEAGYHAGGRFAGLGILGVAVIAPERLGVGALVVSLDAGWFGH